MTNNKTNNLTKPLGSRISEETHMKFHYEAMKRGLSQGAFIEELYKSYRSKITDDEITMLKEVEKNQQLSKAYAKIAEAKKLEETNEANRYKEELLKMKKSSDAKKSDFRKLKAERLKEAAEKELKRLGASDSTEDSDSDDLEATA